MERDEEKATLESLTGPAVSAGSRGTVTLSIARRATWTQGVQISRGQWQPARAHYTQRRRRCVLKDDRQWHSPEVYGRGVVVGRIHVYTRPCASISRGGVDGFSLWHSTRRTLKIQRRGWLSISALNHSTPRRREWQRPMALNQAPKAAQTARHDRISNAARTAVPAVSCQTLQHSNALQERDSPGAGRKSVSR